MNFEKKVIFLGDRPMTMKDGSELHGLTFFDADAQDSVNVNVMGSNAAVMSVVRSVSFGAPCVATFALRDADKRTYRLALVGLSPVKS